MIVKNGVNCGTDQILVKEQRKKNDIRHVTYANNPTKTHRRYVYWKKEDDYKWHEPNRQR